jgi:hypothetical protein
LDLLWSKLFFAFASDAEVEMHFGRRVGHASLKASLRCSRSVSRPLTLSIVRGVVADGTGHIARDDGVVADGTGHIARDDIAHKPSRST